MGEALAGEDEPPSEDLGLSDDGGGLEEGGGVAEGCESPLPDARPVIDAKFGASEA